MITDIGKTFRLLPDLQRIFVILNMDQEKRFTGPPVISSVKDRGPMDFLMSVISMTKFSYEKKRHLLWTQLSPWKLLSIYQTEDEFGLILNMII